MFLLPRIDNRLLRHSTRLNRVCGIKVSICLQRDVSLLSTLVEISVDLS